PQFPVGFNRCKRAIFLVASVDGFAEISDEMLAALKLQLGLVAPALREHKGLDGPLDGLRGELPREHSAIARTVAVGYAVDDGVTAVWQDHETIFAGLWMAELPAPRERFKMPRAVLLTGNP